ncbi:hypothetical protein D3C80_953030 [compost metagenome]
MATRREVSGCKTGVPVVRMDNIRTPERIQTGRHFRPDPTEQRKTQHVVGISE